MSLHTVTTVAKWRVNTSNTHMTNECILWDGTVNPQGYGVRMNSDRAPGEAKQVLAHRWAWAQRHGPIPAGMYICHRCDTPRCVNPDHLFLGTPSDNTRDAIAKGRRKQMPQQERCKRGHLIEARASGVRCCRTCHRDAARRSRALAERR